MVPLDGRLTLPYTRGLNELSHGPRTLDRAGCIVCHQNYVNSMKVSTRPHHYLPYFRLTSGRVSGQRLYRSQKSSLIPLQ